VNISPSPLEADNAPAPSALDQQSEAMLESITERLDPAQAAGIRSRILDAVTHAWGARPAPDETLRFLTDIRIAQDMSGIDMDYAEHYTQMHQAGVDFMALVQAVKAAENSGGDGQSWFSGLMRSVFP